MHTRSKNNMEELMMTRLKKKIVITKTLRYEKQVPCMLNKRFGRLFCSKRRNAVNS